MPGWAMAPWLPGCLAAWLGGPCLARFARLGSRVCLVVHAAWLRSGVCRTWADRRGAVSARPKSRT